VNRFAGEAVLKGADVYVPGRRRGAEDNLVDSITLMRGLMNARWVLISMCPIMCLGRVCTVAATPVQTNSCASHKSLIWEPCASLR